MLSPPPSTHSPFQTFLKKNFRCQQSLKTKTNMDQITEAIVHMAHGPVSVVISSYQMAHFDSNVYVPARIGCRVVEASPESLVGLTADPVSFTCCDHCGACNVTTGTIGTDDAVRVQLVPDDPRSILLATIISETENGRQWGRQMTSPARVSAIINVHRAVKRSETSRASVCFNCNA